MQHFQFIDAIITTGLSGRYDTDQSGLAEYSKLEKMPTTEVVDQDVLAKDSEIEKCTFPVQLLSCKCSSKLTRPSPSTILKPLLPVVPILQYAHCFLKCYSFEIFLSLSVPCNVV